MSILHQLGRRAGSTAQWQELTHAQTHLTSLADPTSQLLPVDPRVGDFSWPHCQLHRAQRDMRGPQYEDKVSQETGNVSSQWPGVVIPRTGDVAISEKESHRMEEDKRPPCTQQRVPPWGSVPMTNLTREGHARAVTVLRLLRALLLVSHHDGRKQGAWSCSLHQLSPTSQEGATNAPTNTSSEQVT